jgi:hypothetical protein
MAAAQPVAPAETPEQVAAAAPAATSACGDLEPIASRAEKAIVNVESNAGEGLGFAFGDAATFIVPARLASSGRGVTVRPLRGPSISARVRAVDDETGVAVVVIDAPLSGVEPLVASSAPIRRGTPVVALGQPWTWPDLDEGPRRRHHRGPREEHGPAHTISSTPGVITAVLGDGFRTDALLSLADRWGAPVVDCQGAVIGAASWGDHATAVRSVTSVARTAAAAREDWSPGWEPIVPLFLALQIDDDVYLGGKIGVGASYYRRWDFALVGSAFGLVDPEEELPTLTEQNRGYRLGLEATAAHRFMVGEGMASVQFVPSIGASFDWTQRFHDVERLQVLDPDCVSDEPCFVTRVDTRTDLGGRARVAPLFGAGLRFFVFELGWAFRLDVEELGSSTHEIRLGGVF